MRGTVCVQVWSGLQILSLDLAKPGLEIPRIGASVPLKSSLLSVEWGSFGIAAKKSKVRCQALESVPSSWNAVVPCFGSQYSSHRIIPDGLLHVQYGILAGSLSSGEVVLWDPMAIVNQAAATPAIHTWKPSENGQVLANTS